MRKENGLKYNFEAIFLWEKETFSHLLSHLCRCECALMHLHINVHVAFVCVCVNYDITCIQGFSTHALAGPAQRHTHFKGVRFGSNAVGLGRW